MVEIRNQEDLEQWLQGRSREEAVAIAVRAALRVTPLLGRARPDKAFYLRSLHTGARAIDSAMFFINSQERAPANAATTNSKKFTSDSEASKAAYFAADSTKEYSIFSAAFAIGHAADAAAFSNEADATITVESAVDAAHHDIWSMLSHDASTLEADFSPKSLMKSPLWLEDAPRWASEAWRDLKAYLAQFPEEHWEVWTDWYEARLEGRPIDWDLQRKRVMIPYEEDLWDQGPTVVNARIKQIIAEHSSPPRPEDFPQDSRVPSFVTDGESIDVIDVDDSPAPDLIHIDREATQVHAAARRAVQKMKDRFSRSNDSEILGAAATAQEALDALGATIQDISPSLTVLQFNFLELALETDERRRTPRNPRDKRHPPLPTEELADLEAAVRALRLLVRRDDFMRASDDIAHGRHIAEAPPQPLEDFLQKGRQADFITERAAAIARNS